MSVHSLVPFCPPRSFSSSPSSRPLRKNQQYDSKWCVPLTELSFQGPEEVEPLTVPQVPDEELDALKVKISHLRSELQKEKVGLQRLRLGREKVSGAAVFLQRANKGPKVLERLRKKLCEQESMLLLMSPSMHLRLHHKNGKVSASTGAWLWRVEVLFLLLHLLSPPLSSCCVSRPSAS